MSRPNQAKLNLSALRHNVTSVRELAPHSRLMAVVKANAYGHGSLTIARELEGQTDALAVACIEEAVQLRDAGIAGPILLLQGVYDAAELSAAAQLDLWITIENEQQLLWLEQATLTQALHCWLKVDTGMNRLGVATARAAEFYRRIQGSKNTTGDTVLTTHFASADDLDNPQTQQQLDIFNSVPVDAPRSAANSAAVLAWPQSHYDWVRPGFMLYGNSPLLQEHAVASNLQPVMTLSSAIISIRDVKPGQSVGYAGTWIASRPSRIATVTIGYGDGYPRAAANGTPVLIRGQRAPLAGRVSMDMITVDVTELQNAEIGDEVILWGEGLPLAEVAARSGTIGYELTTRMPARTPRVIAEPKEQQPPS